MPVVVQKYGGSSVADVEKIRRVAARVSAARDRGYQVVVVVSAMGDTTDELLALAKQVSEDPPRRELDMLLTCGERISMALLSMALQERGVAAISFTGSQSGIITTDAHSQARILEVRPHRILDALAEGRVVIVAGYQGVSLKREVTTLGRGGSDTTAVALAAALGAEACEIYSDVDGVFSADPRVVPDAVQLESLSYDEMQELATAGAKVLNAQAVEFAKRSGIVIRARSAHTEGQGTRVEALATRQDTRIAGVSSEADVQVLSASLARVTLGELLAFLEARGVRGHALTYEAATQRVLVQLPLEDVHGLAKLEQDLAASFQGDVTLLEGVGTVTCVGAGLQADWKPLQRAIQEAHALGATLHGVHTSALHLTLLVDKAFLKPLTRRLHQALF